MSANLSGNNIDNGDFMIKTCAADPEGGYAKEKFHADPKNGIIISEVDGVKGKRLEFSADWSVVSLETELKQGDNIEIGKDQVSGKVEISAPDVGKVLVNSSDANADFLNNKINCIFPLQKSVHLDSQLQIRVWDKLNFAQFNAKWENGDYDKSDISGYYGETAMLGKIYCDNTELYGVCFVLIRGNPLTLHIRYTATSDVDCILYYRAIGELNWNSQSVTLNNSLGEATTKSFEVADTGDAPLEFLLVCEEDTGVDIIRIFEIYAD